MLQMGCLGVLAASAAIRLHRLFESQSDHTGFVWLHMLGSVDRSEYSYVLAFPDISDEGSCL